MTKPTTLADVKAIRDPLARAQAATAYLERLTQFRTDALVVRDQALREIETGPTETARAVGVSVSTVKLARRTR